MGRKEGKVVEFTPLERRLMVCAGIGKTLISHVEFCGASKDTALAMYKVTGRPLLELLYGDAGIEEKLLQRPKQPRGRPRKEDRGRSRGAMKAG